MLVWMAAADRGRKDIVELLIAAGADLERTDNSGHSPLSHAAERGHKEIASVLITVSGCW